MGFDMEKLPKRKTRKQIMKALENIQMLVGRAKGIAWNDRDPNRMQNLQDALDEAFNLCLTHRD